MEIKIAPKAPKILILKSQISKFACNFYMKIIMSSKATKILMLEFQISKFAGNFNIEN